MTELAETLQDSSFSGLTFNFTYGAGIPLSQINDVIRNAAQVGAEWSSYLKDNVALNVQIEFVDLPDPVISGARPAMVKVNYKDFVTALFDDQTSQQDWAVLNNLQLDGKDRDTLQNYANGTVDPSKVKFGTQSFALYLDSQFNQSSKSGQGNSFLDENGNDNNKKIWLTRANAKALDLIKSDDQKLDVVLQMSRSAVWDFNPNDGIAAGAYDFNTVLKHEIGHALGFVSGVDAFEFLTLTQTKVLNDKDLTYVSPMDLFRYSAESAQQGVIDLRIGGGIEKFFSLDAGRSKLADFATGGTNVGGDGYQASHWKSSAAPLGIMQPNLQTGQSLTISGLDLQLLDAIGWDLKSPLGTKAAAVGLDWNQLNQQLRSHQQTVISNLATSWAAKNPGYSIQSDLKDEVERLNFKLNQDIDKELNSLTKKIGSITDPIKREKEIQSTVDKIWDLQDRQDQNLAKFAKDREKLDLQARKWLDLDAKKLAEELQTAVGVEFLALGKLLNSVTGNQRNAWEAKLTTAFSYFTDKPSKAVQELLKSTGPGNPIGWRGSRYWTWFQTGEDASLDILFHANGSAAASTSVDGEIMTDPLTGLILA